MKDGKTNFNITSESMEASVEMSNRGEKKPMKIFRTVSCLDQLKGVSCNISSQMV